jgi:hypothetical protein
MRLFILILGSILFIELNSCKKDSKKSKENTAAVSSVKPTVLPPLVMKPLDLSKYGVPTTIIAPDTPKIKNGNISFMKDLTIRQDDRYNLQVFHFPYKGTDVSKAVAQEKDYVKNIRFFSKIVKEEPNGFIFEFSIPIDTVRKVPTYGFRYFMIAGGRLYNFQQGFGSAYKLDEAEKIYESVKPK